MPHKFPSRGPFWPFQHNDDKLTCDERAHDDEHAHDVRHEQLYDAHTNVAPLCDAHSTTRHDTIVTRIPCSKTQNIALHTQALRVLAKQEHECHDSPDDTQHETTYHDANHAPIAF